MEDCYNYNQIIQAIEENIHLEDKEIYKLAANAAGLSRREAALIVKSVEGEDYNMYIKRRKIIRCAQHKMLNADETWQNIAANFAIFEYSTFNRRFKAFLGVTPEDFPNKYKGDVMKIKPAYIGKNNVLVKTETLVKKEIETIYVETEPDIIFINNAPNDLSFLPEEDPHPLATQLLNEYNQAHGNANEMGEILKEAFSINSTPSRPAEHIKELVIEKVNSDSDAKALLDVYSTIMELEEVRSIYGLAFNEVLYLYLKNNKDSATLYEMCERICDERIEEIYAKEFEEEPDWEEWEEEHFTDELRYSEAYAYYQGEDEMEYENEEGFDNNSIKHMYW